jgi:phosphoribosylglycinamide formyltransferase-1
MSVEPSLARLGVLISGRGSNLQALIDAQRDGALGGAIVVVISNRPEAEGVERARAAGIETRVMPHGAHASRDDYDRALVAELQRHRVRLVCLAGFMRRLGPTFCDAFPDAILNIHPSLLPAFPGTHAPRQALEHGVTVSGATVHFVTPELDAGPIVLQEAVAVLDEDGGFALGTVLLVEHRLLRRPSGGSCRTLAPGRPPGGASSGSHRRGARTPGILICDR